MTPEPASRLDEATIARAVPPGSMRYLATLFSPLAKRSVLEALYVIEAEVFDSARSANHDVAHTRLQWWRGEVDRLTHGDAQHPASRTLLGAPDAAQLDFRLLHEMLVAADMDLARLTYGSAAELDAYARRAGGVVQTLAVQWLSAPATPSSTVVEHARRLGGAIRQTEALRDLRQDVRDGRLYLPLDELDARGLGLDDLRGAEVADPLRELLASWHIRIATTIAASEHEVAHSERPSLRHTFVLARLHVQLLKRLARRRYDVTSRAELGSFERVFAAWRAARFAR